MSVILDEFIEIKKRQSLLSMKRYILSLAERDDYSKFALVQCICTRKACTCDCVSFLLIYMIICIKNIVSESNYFCS